MNLENRRLSGGLYSQDKSECPVLIGGQPFMPCLASLPGDSSIAFQAQLNTQLSNGAPASLLPALPSYYACGPIFMPVHMQSHVQACIGDRSGPQTPWKLEAQAVDQTYWYNVRSSLRKTNSTETGTGVFLPQERGTGVFLPQAQSKKKCSDDPLANEVPGSDSDGDSSESASDCIVLEESHPAKTGHLKSQCPIEQLLPDEWEY